MKSKVLFVSLLLMAAMNAQAQDGKSKWSVIPRIGINSSIVSNKAIYLCDGASSSRNCEEVRKIGLTVGADIDYQYSRWLSTSLGVSYSNEGYSIDYGNSYVGKQSYKYMGLSALENLYLVKGLALKAGLQAGYLANDPNDSYNDSNWNFSIPIGVSYEYKKVVLDLRYHIGLQDIDGYKYNRNEKCKTSSLWLTLGYRIGL